MNIQSFSTTPPVNQANVTYKPNNAERIGIVNIGRKEAIKFFTSRPVGEGVVNLPFTSYVIVMGESEWIQLSYYGSREVAGFFERILSTFRFLD